MWHMENYPDEYKARRLWHTHNSETNKVKAMLLASMGLRAGVADLTYIAGPGRIVFIELKVKDRSQHNAQLEFEAMVREFGFEYYVCKNTLNNFINLFNSIKHGDS